MLLILQKLLLMRFLFLYYFLKIKQKHFIIIYPHADGLAKK